ncbi:hypothetical protein WJN01_00800 [Flavobacteriaceae bacterium SZ-1-7]|uniref:hypothetical protein n=1 Tax=Tamlana sedimenti TaxID=3134126 RepID=UPI003123BC47
MIARWCISVLIFTLTLFGVVSQQQVTLPNQEIVLQFSDVALTSDDTQYAIASVKKQLQDLGAENIKVKHLENGSINIEYFSDADTASIKEILSNNEVLAFDFSDNPTKENKSHLPFNDKVYFDLDVYEIQNGNDTKGDLNGAIVLEVEVKSNRSLEPNINLFFNPTDLKGEADFTKRPNTIRKNIAIAIKNTSHKIPEGRAGPVC